MLKYAFNPFTGKIDMYEDLVPIGASFAWYKSLSGTPTLLPNFVELNGQTLNDTASPYHNVVLPDANGVLSLQPRFLRGAATSGGMGGNDVHCHVVTGCVLAAGGHCHSYSGSGFTDSAGDHSHGLTGVSFSFSGSGTTDADFSSTTVDQTFAGSTTGVSSTGHCHGFSFGGSGSASGFTDSAGNHSHGYSFSGSTDSVLDHTHPFCFGGTDNASNIPSYINVVYIMRIK